MPFLVGTCGTIDDVVQPSKTLSIYHRYRPMSSVRVSCDESSFIPCSPAANAGRFAVHLVECAPFPVDPLIARPHVFTQSALFEFAIDHVIGVRVLVEARQW
jgi:hypothetical protein